MQGAGCILSRAVSSFAISCRGQRSGASFYDVLLPPQSLSPSLNQSPRRGNTINSHSGQEINVCLLSGWNSLLTLTSLLIIGAWLAVETKKQSSMDEAVMSRTTSLFQVQLNFESNLAIARTSGADRAMKKLDSSSSPVIKNEA